MQHANALLTVQGRTANTGTVQVGQDTTVFLDEAGMADHKRLDALTELVERWERS